MFSSDPPQAADSKQNFLGVRLQIVPAIPRIITMNAKRTSSRRVGQCQGCAPVQKKSRMCSNKTSVVCPVNTASGPPSQYLRFSTKVLHVFCSRPSDKSSPIFRFDVGTRQPRVSRSRPSSNSTPRTFHPERHKTGHPSSERFQQSQSPRPSGYVRVVHHPKTTAESYADFMNVESRCVLFAVMFAGIVACVGCAPKSLDDLPNLTRDETLWTGPSGSRVVIYRYGMAVGKTPEALVCEQGQHKDVIERLPADSFALTSGNELKIIRQSQYTLPGWYKITRPSDLNWWQRTFSNKSIGEWVVVRNQASLPKPSQSDAQNAVVSFVAGNWQKLADQSQLKNLLEVPGEGIVYVGEPGIGVLQTIDLLGRCP